MESFALRGRAFVSLKKPLKEKPFGGSLEKPALRGRAFVYISKKIVHRGIAFETERLYSKRKFLKAEPSWAT